MILLKNHKLIFIIALVLVSSCSKAILPKNSDINNSPYGSFIIVRTFDKKVTTGEFITIANDSLFVRKNMKLYKVPVKNIKFTRVFYANPENYLAISILFFTIPFLPYPGDYYEIDGYALLHGFVLLYSLPVISIVIGILSSIATSDYSFKNLPIEELKYFSRFPQGIPDGVDLEKL